MPYQPNLANSLVNTPLTAEEIAAKAMIDAEMAATAKAVAHPYKWSAIAVLVLSATALVLNVARTFGIL